MGQVAKWPTSANQTTIPISGGLIAFEHQFRKESILYRFFSLKVLLGSLIKKKAFPKYYENFMKTINNNNR